MFALVTRWCVHGDNIICVGAVVVDEVWVVFVSIGVTLYVLVPKCFTNLCKASPCHPWKV